MNKDQALQILIQGVEIAQSKGAYNLQDSATILQAIQTLTQKEEALEN